MNAHIAWMYGLGPMPSSQFMPTQAHEDQFRKDLESWLNALDNEDRVYFAIAFALKGPYVTDEFRQWASDWETGKDRSFHTAHEIWRKSKMEIEQATEAACCYDKRDFSLARNSAFNCAWYRRLDTDVYAVYARFLEWHQTLYMFLSQI